VFARAAESDEAILAVLDKAILYPIDCEKGEGIEIAKRYNVRGYPTFKMVDGAGEELECWIGFEGPEKWVVSVEAGVADPRTLAEKAKAYETEPTLALAKTLATAAATKYDFKGAVEYYRTARNMEPNPMAAAEYTEGILTSMFYGSRSGQFEFADVDAEASQVMAHPMAPVDAKMGVASMLVYLAKSTDNTEKAIPYLETAMKVSEGSTDEGILEQRASLAVDHALLVEQDKDKAVELKRATLDEGWQEAAGALNEFAWWCFENTVNLEEAEQLALKGVKLAETDGERANILDTAAEICNALGNCEEAVARIKQAIELDPQKDYFQTQLARFEEDC
jgi:tetratricopeptide (TPR) repeat protein